MAVKLLDCRHGPQLYFTTDLYFAPLLENYKEYVYGEGDLFQQLVREGDIVVDAGANIGCHSVVLGKIVGDRGSVMAFEPQQPIFYALCGTLALNELWHVQAYPFALGAEHGKTKVPFLRYDEKDSFGGVSVGGLVGQDVPVVPLDMYNLARLKLLKVDVEGAEIDALMGARETIRRCRPFLYVENDRKQHSDRLIETMLGFEYLIYLHTPMLFNRDNFGGCKENLFPNVASVMLLGVPAECPIGEINLPQIHQPNDMVDFGKHVIAPKER